MSLLDNLPHTVTLKRQGYAKDSLNASVTTETTVSTGIAAWVQLTAKRSYEEMERRDQIVTHKVFLAEDPGLKIGDVLHVTDGPAFFGEQLLVLDWADETAGMGLAIAVDCEKQRTA